MSSKQKQSNTTMNATRRAFLKKAVYATPTIMALGALTKPTESEAGFGPPPSAPDWN